MSPSTLDSAVSDVPRVTGAGSFVRGHAAALAVAALVLVVAVIQVLTRATTLTELDSGNLALALDDFDVSRHQPHPPGYPLLVGAAHLLTWLGGALEAYLALAAVFSLGAVAVTALLARELFGRRAAFPAAALVVATPLVLYYAGIVSVYPAEAFFMPLVVLLAARTGRRADRWSAPALPVVLAVGAGFRPSLLVFALPACAVGLVVGRPAVRRLLVGVGAAAVVVVAWMVPTVVEAGGVSDYLSAGRLYRQAAERTWFALGGNGVSNGALATAAVALAALPSAVLVLACWRHRPRGGWRWWLLAAWAAPYVLFSGLVHLGKPGYLLAAVPAFAVAAAGLTADHRRAPAVAALVAAAGMAYYLLVPNVALPERIESYRPFAFAPTADAIRIQDAQAKAFIDFAPTCVPPACTVVSMQSSERFWEHEPFGLEDVYAPGTVVRLRDVNGPERPLGAAIWAGYRPPSPVIARATELAPVGTWRIFRSDPATTRAILADLREEQP